MIPAVVISPQLVDRARAFLRLPDIYDEMLEESLLIVGQLAIEYTRGSGFDASGNPGATASAVIVKAGARLAANTDQTRRNVGNASIRSFFDEWDAVEKKLLDSLRRTAR